MLDRVFKSYSIMVFEAAGGTCSELCDFLITSLNFKILTSPYIYNLCGSPELLFIKFDHVVAMISLSTVCMEAACKMIVCGLGMPSRINTYRLSSSDARPHLMHDFRAITNISFNAIEAYIHRYYI